MIHAESVRAWEAEIEHFREIIRSKDVENAKLRTALANVRAYIKDCDHEPALDEIDCALANEQETTADWRLVKDGGLLPDEECG